MSRIRIYSREVLRKRGGKKGEKERYRNFLRKFFHLQSRVNRPATERLFRFSPGLSLFSSPLSAFPG